MSLLNAPPSAWDAISRLGNDILQASYLLSPLTTLLFEAFEGGEYIGVLSISHALFFIFFSAVLVGRATTRCGKAWNGADPRAPRGISVYAPPVGGTQ